MIGTEFARFAGGKAANVAYVARKLDIDARLFAHTGDDDLAREQVEQLANRFNVNTPIAPINQ